MRYCYLFLLLSGTALAQVPTQPARRDSVPTRFRMPADRAILDKLPFLTKETPPRPMPTVRPRNDFYRRPGDNPNVVRATLDNMPVLMSDTSSVPMPTHGHAQPRRRKPNP